MEEVNKIIPKKKKCKKAKGFSEEALQIVKERSKKQGRKGKFSSVQFSHSVVSDSLRRHELQHARLPCP